MTNEFIDPFVREGSWSASVPSPARYLDVVATGYARGQRCCAPWCLTAR
jgi:hypothetical protein